MQLQTDSFARVETLRAAHVERTAELLAGAFEIDAAYRYLFPDAVTRGAGLHDFFARNLETHMAHACTFVGLDARGQALATVTLRPPNGLHISLWTMLRRGLLPFAAAHGVDAVRRLLWLKRTYDALEAEAAANQPHAYVHMMAVAPEHQGAGLGSRLLAEVLGARGAVQTVLTTNLARNVAFYRRHGFDVFSERGLQPPDSHVYTVWSMRRV
jgi:ribosomal protein S18 acetylase RimI-like enzyme